MTSPTSACQVRTVLERIGDKWAIYVVDRLGEGPRRFTELHRAIDGITARMLTVTLRGLERDGIVTRTVHASVPPRVDYELTPLGLTLLDTIGQLVAWADAHITEIKAARDDYDARSCPPPCAEDQGTEDPQGEEQGTARASLGLAGQPGRSFRTIIPGGPFPVGPGPVGRVRFVESVNFDRAAGYYDATRALSPSVMAELTGVLAPELAPAHRQPCLEIGVGTGRIALPLHGQGVRLAGADIAEAMLRRLVANAHGVMPFPLLLADATRLPLARQSFGSVLAVHVLHLIPNWKDAVDEAARVLRPGGALVASFPGGGTAATGRALRSAATAPWAGVVREAAERHGVVRRAVGARDPDEVAAHLADRAAARVLAPVPVTETLTLRRVLHDLEEQVYSWTWPFTPGQLRAAGADIRAWADREGFSLDESHQVTGALQWWAFELPG